MRTFLFFGYRDWAINIFKSVSASCGDQWLLVTDKRSCNKEFIDKLKPAIIFFYGWSWIVPGEIVNNYCCLCLHPSPLPRYRGGSPIQNQIMAGETESAVTIFKMNGELDAGDIVFQEEMSLAGYLQNILIRIEKLGIKGTIKIIEDYNNDYVGGKQQDNEKATYCKRRTPEQARIYFGGLVKHDVDYFYNLIRCSQPPYPECYIEFDRGRLIIEKVRYEL